MEGNLLYSQSVDLNVKKYHHSRAMLMGKINHPKWLYRHYCLLNPIHQGISLKEAGAPAEMRLQPKVSGTFEQLSESWALGLPWWPSVRLTLPCRGPRSDPGQGTEPACHGEGPHAATKIKGAFHLRGPCLRGPVLTHVGFCEQLEERHGCLTLSLSGEL